MDVPAHCSSCAGARPATGAGLLAAALAARGRFAVGVATRGAVGSLLAFTEELPPVWGAH